MRRPDAYGPAGYAADLAERTGEGYSSAPRAIPFLCIQTLYVSSRRQQIDDFTETHSYDPDIFLIFGRMPGRSPKPERLITSALAIIASTTIEHKLRDHGRPPTASRLRDSHRHFLARYTPS